MKKVSKKFCHVKKYTLLCFIIIKTKTMKTRINEIKEMKRLHERAVALLEAAEDMQERIDTKLKFNLETAAPVGFKPFSDEQIDTCVRGRDRLMYSHLKVISAILEV